MNRPAVVLTGHAGGIGTAIATELTANGYRVIGIDSAHAAEFANDSLAFDLALLADPSTHEAFRASLASTIKADSVIALINNAAVQRTAQLHEMETAPLLESLAVNAIAPLILFQILRPALILSEGTVINISSVHTTLTKPQFGAYAMSKAALSSLSRTLSIEEQGRVRIVELTPGAVSTPMLEQGFEGKSAQRAQLDDCQPIGRIATAQEIAEMCAAIVNMKSKALNGASINLDGGISSVLHDPA